jgi:hypothetical protein
MSSVRGMDAGSVELNPTPCRVVNRVTRRPLRIEEIARDAAVRRALLMGSGCRRPARRSLWPLRAFWTCGPLRTRSARQADGAASTWRTSRPSRPFDLGAVASNVRRHRIVLAQIREDRESQRAECDHQRDNRCDLPSAGGGAHHALGIRGWSPCFHGCPPSSSRVSMSSDAMPRVDTYISRTHRRRRGGGRFQTDHAAAEQEQDLTSRVASRAGSHSSFVLELPPSASILLTGACAHGGPHAWKEGCPRSGSRFSAQRSYCTPARMCAGPGILCGAA